MFTVLLCDSLASSRNTETESFLPPTHPLYTLFLISIPPPFLACPTQNENTQYSFRWKAWIFLPTSEVTVPPEVQGQCGTLINIKACFSDGTHGNRGTKLNCL